MAIAAALQSNASAFEIVPAIKEQAPGPGTRGSVACAEASDRSESLNGLELFRASASCFQEERPFEGTFLLVAGQIRAITDLSMLRALGDADKITVAELYGLIFHQTGGAGSDELYRDHELTDALFRRLDGWTPQFSDDYDPGWDHQGEVGPGSYSRAVEIQKARRIVQLEHHASLIRRDDYYAAGKELDELQRRNPKGFTAGSHDAERAAELIRLMRQIDQETQAPMPGSESSEAFHHEPRSDAEFKQLYIGTNGPTSAGVLVLESRRAAEASWLARAMAQGHLEVFLSEVDFERQILIAFSVGERTTATGALSITEVSYDEELDLMSIAGRVGVNEHDCHLSPAKSYMFALAVAERPPKVPEFPGYAVSNFGDGCKPPRSGLASD